MPRLLHAFASDNYAGVHPDVMAALAAANGGHEVAYGEDSVTAELGALIRGACGSCRPSLGGATPRWCWPRPRAC
jgi:threonine aldolase